ncbi:hypothetical protein BX616_009883 [Lobosporangium transversale]|nr:hypothetical protein BX616_009883 [Lobosporangium transversale]
MRPFRSVYMKANEFYKDGVKVSSDVELWAHRSILCRYKPFVDIIKRVPKPTKLSWIKDTNDMRTTEETLYSTCSTETNENFDNNPSDFAVVVVQKFSAATICAMLLYIYTGEVNLAVDTGKFAISKGNSCLRVSSSQGQYAKAIAPHSLESDVVWGFKDATWAELLAAAEEYGVADLKERCEREICDDINESNAFELLFKVGTRFEEVKNSVIAYIVFNMDSMFPKDSDPFAPYKDHPSCHDMMLEVMRQRAEYDP